MWMPTAGQDEVELAIPMHTNLEVVNVSVQPFNNCEFGRENIWDQSSLTLFHHLGARRLITYRRLPEGEFSDITFRRQKDDEQGVNADELNEFRRKVCQSAGSLLVELDTDARKLVFCQKAGQKRTQIWRRKGVMIKKKEN